MTIGPEPTTSTLRGAPGAFGSAMGVGLELLDEAVEEVLVVLGPGAGFGVVLDGEDGEVPVDEPLDGAVVQVEVGDDEPALWGDARRVHLEAVVLGGDVDPAGAQVLHRVVGPPVAELEAGGLPPDGQPGHLVPEADPGQGQPALPDRPLDQAAEGLNRPLQGRVAVR